MEDKTNTGNGVGTNTGNGVGTNTGNGVGTNTGNGVGTNTGNGVDGQAGESSFKAPFRGHSFPQKIFPETVKPAAAIRAANALAEAQIDPALTVEHILVELSEGVGMEELLMQGLFEQAAVDAVTRRLQIAILAAHIIGVLQALAMMADRGAPEHLIKEILDEMGADVQGNSR